jgi:UDP-glucose 6-dehydrogenase
MKIGIIGKGTVGKAVYDGLEFLGHQMSFFDPAYEGSKLTDILATEVVFISVPTNQLPNGDCDISIVEKVLSELNDIKYLGLIAIKSTVVPGTCDLVSKKYPNLQICSVPEFLRAKAALTDFTENHDLLIIGSHREKDYDLIKKAISDEMKLLRVLGGHGVNVARVMHPGIIEIMYPPMSGTEFQCVVTEYSHVGYLDKYMQNYLAGTFICYLIVFSLNAHI